jgi:glycine betaine/proline transport system ATP-binding protein
MKDGEIIQLGSPQDIIMNPVDDFVKEFTQGIPKTKVINVASIISEPELIIADWRRIENLVAQMDRAGTEYAICVDTDNKYIGVIPKQKVTLLAGRPAGDLTDILHTDVATVHPETLLEQALAALVDATIPIPVVDGSNCFLGVAAQRDILMVIAANL